ncbi:MAG: hypothetical protein JRF06_06580 [Deltaproteobacteria bacterium]|nr:hypothetical protein [Deltaproteobacteria bacterium]
MNKIMFSLALLTLVGCGEVSKVLNSDRRYIVNCYSGGVEIYSDIINRIGNKGWFESDGKSDVKVYGADCVIIRYYVKN